MTNPKKFTFNPLTGNFDIITNTDAEGLTLNAPIISSVTPTVPVTGQMWMNSGLNVKVAGGTLQVGEEMYTNVINKTGVILANGRFIYTSGVDSGYPKAVLAQANTLIAHNTLAMTTNAIAINAVSNVTTTGIVHDLNTLLDSEGHALVAGDLIYLSATVAGGYTNVEPYAPNYSMQLGSVLVVDGSVGQILVDIQRNNARDLALITKDPTGFNNPENVTITYDPTGRTITLGSTGSGWTVYWRGAVVTQVVTGHVSVAHGVTTGSVYYYYFDGTNVVWAENASWSFDMVMIATVQYGATDKFAIRECHGLMDWRSHQEFHRTIGTYRSSGGTLSGYTIGSTTLHFPAVSQCTIFDEDLQSILPALPTGTYTNAYLSGTTTTPIINFVTGYAHIQQMVGNVPRYNLLTGGNWTQAAQSGGNYQAIFLFAIPVTSSAGSQLYRFVWLEGQQQNATLSTIQALTPADLVLGNLTSLSSEFVFITKIIVQYNGGGGGTYNIVQVNDLTGNRFTQSSTAAGVYLSAVEHDTSLTGDGTTATPLATAYPVAVAADWDVGVDPITPNSALDKIASQGVVKVQAKNTAYRGPTTGANALPTFRTPVGEDFAAAATVPTDGRVLTAKGAGIIPQWVDPSFTQAALTQSYTPVLTASSGTAPSNYTATGYWFAIGDQVFVNVEIIMTGAGTSDAGVLRISNPGSYTHSNTLSCIGNGEALDASSVVISNLTVSATAGDAFVTMICTDENALVSYAVPQTWAVGDKIELSYNFKAVQLSSYLTLYSNPMDAIGQLIYGGVSGVPTKLAAGTAQYILQSNAGAAPTWIKNTPVQVPVTSAGALDLSLYFNAAYMCSNAADITIDLSTIAGGVRDGNRYVFKNIGAKLITLNPNGSEVIDDSATSYVLNPMQSVTLNVYNSKFYIV